MCRTYLKLSILRQNVCNDLKNVFYVRKNNRNIWNLSQVWSIMASCEDHSSLQKPSVRVPDYHTLYNYISCVLADRPVPKLKSVGKVFVIKEIMKLLVELITA